MSKKLPTFFLAGEAERIIESARTERERLILLVLLHTGLRVMELANLQVADLDFGRKVVWVRKAKGSKQRMLPLMHHLVAPLRGWIGKRLSGTVFPSRQGGGPLTTCALRFLVKRVAKRAGFKGDALARAHPHTFRHEFLTRCLRAGADIREIQELAGHSQLSSTMVYLQTDPDRLRAAVDRVYE